MCEVLGNNNALQMGRKGPWEALGGGSIGVMCAVEYTELGGSAT